jgi:GMP reductase
MKDFLYAEPHLNYKNVILRHNKSVVASRDECDTSTYFGKKKYAVPVCCANMQSIITPEICRIFDSKNWFYVYQRVDGSEDVEQFVINSQGFNTVSISVGVGKEWEWLVNRLKIEEYRVDAFTVDVALSYNDNVIPIIKNIRDKYPEAFLIVGNGCTADWVKFMVELKVDCIKTGVGVSKSCRTRQYTGFGSSTVTSLIECVDAADGKVKVMSDGGLTVDENGEVWIGDINKSLVIGSDYVMTGAAFSKCIDSPSIINGYYGNASATAKKSKKHIEGAKIQVETNGYTISEMCDLIQDSIKSGISYGGGRTLEAFKSVKWRVIST